MDEERYAEEKRHFNLAQDVKKTSNYRLMRQD